MTDTKYCPKCNKDKPKENFALDKNTKDGLYSWCQDCRKEYNQNYYIKNQERENSRCKNYYINNSEKEKRKTHENRLANLDARRGYDRNYAREHREKRLLDNKAWTQNNKDRVQQNERKRYLKNPRKKIENNKKWAKNNPEKISARNHARRARVRGNGGRWTSNQWFALLAYYAPEGYCLACNKKKTLTKDHVVPIVIGGSSNISNIQPLCMKCNRQKHIKEKDYRPDGGIYARWVEKNIK